MSAADHAKAIAKLMKALRAKYTPDPVVERDPIVELVYAFLLWDAPSTKANAAMRRLEESFVDMNELRVSRPAEVMASLGKTYPRLEERVLRMRETLRDLYKREHAVSLAKAAEMPKRDARSYLETLEGITPFIAARVALVALGAHAIPIEERLMGKLVAGGVFTEDTPIDKAAGLLERYIPAEEGVESHLLLQALSEDTSFDPETLLSTKKSRSRSTKSTTTKKAGTRKRTRSRAASS
ncbi:MAG: hypothetical protein KDA20_10035 [Phycisphaerales bacterium]|nr:hypothetical protein [Phycisphaerales bacterium]